MSAAKTKSSIDIPMDGVGEPSGGQKGRSALPAGNKKKQIDIPLDGVGGPPAVQRSRIDIPLENPRSPVEESRRISALELELVNRHHAEVKELYRRAKKGE